MTDTPIEHVSDTALWVAYYRGEESERPDALFNDPYAKRLAGEKGRRIAVAMSATSPCTAWILSIRTVVIDRMIQDFIAESGKIVLNLGAGLDTRPYRMALPANLLWIEVDHPPMIAHKEKILADEKASCRLERVSLDLSQQSARRALLASVAARSENILVITEGVIPYLTEAQVAELAHDLQAHPSFRYWIAEYFSKKLYRYFQNSKRLEKMKNSPFVFFPDEWFGFFERFGWTARTVKYLGEEGKELNRQMPTPWWASLLRFLPAKNANAHLRLSAYVLFARKES